jgi:hypothetical protein
MIGTGYKFFRTHFKNCKLLKAGGNEKLEAEENPPTLHIKNIIKTTGCSTAIVLAPNLKNWHMTCFR